MLYPVPLTAATENVYRAPFVSPVTVNGEPAPVTDSRDAGDPSATASTGHGVTRYVVAPLTAPKLTTADPAVGMPLDGAIDVTDGCAGTPEVTHART